MPDLLTRFTVDKVISQLRSLAPVSNIQRGLSLGRAILAAAHRRFKMGAEREFECWGTDENPQLVSVPWEFLTESATRDLSHATTPQLVGQQLQPVVLPLIGSGIGRAGAVFVPNCASDQSVAYVGASPTFQWLANESSALTLDTATTIGLTAASPNVGGIAVRASRQLRQQSDLDQIMPPLLTQIANDALDVAALNGSGASGAPLGLLQNASVVATSGTSMNYSGLASMEENCCLNDANDERLAWIAAPNVRRILRQRELNTGSGSLWPDATLLGHPAIVTSKMPSASLLCGDFSNLTVFLFGSRGLEVLVDPFTAFSTGRITFLVRLSVGLVVSFPGAFRKSTTVS